MPEKILAPLVHPRHFAQYCIDGSCTHWVIVLRVSCAKLKLRTFTLLYIKYFHGLLKEVIGQNVEIDIFPNPAESAVTFSFGKHLSGQVTIFDNLGKEVLRSEITGQTTLDVSSLPPGMYTAMFYISEYDLFTGRKLVIQ